MTIAKYSANGNDFVIFHTFQRKDYSDLAKKLCHRTEGIGADGLIVLIPHHELDFEWLFYNSDGSDAAMCGNGSRACAHYAFYEGLASSKLRFLTQAGSIESQVEEHTVQTQLTPHAILKENFEEEGLVWWLIDTGVPHLVTLVDHIDRYDKTVCQVMRERYNANVNFMSLFDPSLSTHFLAAALQSLSTNLVKSVSWPCS